MNLQIRAKDLKLGDATKSHIEHAVEAFRKYSLDITSIHCNLIAEKKGVLVEFEIHVAHAEPIIISQHDEVLDAAIDLAMDRAEKALRRLHDKMKDHKAVPLKELEPVDA
ncbi:MAG: ribosome-associated translation inhibitor RaiA [Epsilonproteobacteria bacterium]|nr:ribosome-associated translation inhibitor RaiA [Campylobacterota bacterium]